MDWPTIITIVLGSSVLGAAINSAISWFLQSRDRGRSNSFLALTLAHSFESYTSDCVDLVEDHDLYSNSKGSAGTVINTPPKSFTLPEESFRDFDLKLLDSVLDFPQRVAFATNEINFMAGVAGSEEAQEICYRNTITLAIHALSIADQLRTSYSLGLRKLRFGSFDLREVLIRKSTSQNLLKKNFQNGT